MSSAATGKQGSILSRLHEEFCKQFQDFKKAENKIQQSHLFFLWCW